MPIRVQMPNGTVRPFREGTPKSVIRRAIADMLADMKASGDYDACDFSEFEPKAKAPRKVEVTQFGPTRIARPDEIDPGLGAHAIPNLPGIGINVAPTVSPQPKSAYTRERLAAILFNEAQGFQGDGQALQGAFDNMAHVILNRENAQVKESYGGKNPTLASDQLSSANQSAIATYPPSKRAYDRALAAADRALADPNNDPTMGATQFWHPNFTHPKMTPQPPWATGVPATVSGPFTTSQTGDDAWTVNTYHNPQLERNGRNVP